MGNSRKRRTSCSEKVETHPTNTLASADEFSMNFRGGQLPRESPTPREFLSIPLPRAPMNSR